MSCRERARNSIDWPCPSHNPISKFQSADQIMKTSPSLRLVLLRICTLTAVLSPVAQIPSTNAAPACEASYQLLHSFGELPEPDPALAAALVQETDGALYGTTSAGSICTAGTVFKVNRDGTGYTQLHAFWLEFHFSSPLNNDDAGESGCVRARP
jgi:uncharacterized repeat protein (TIGR03803 family)